MRTLYILLALTLTGCGGSGSSPPPPPVQPDQPPIMSLDGIYRGSPVVVSADGFTYDYEDSGNGPHWGSLGRVYTTTVTGNAISGTATIYRPEGMGGITTAPLDGTIDAQGNVTISFVDGAVNVSVNVARINEPTITLIGRAWCNYNADGTLNACAEFDVLNRLVIDNPASGDPNDILSIEGVTEVETNLYDVSLQSLVCNGNGLMSFAKSEDGLRDEVAISVVCGSAYLWWVFDSTIP